MSLTDEDKTWITEAFDKREARPVELMRDMQSELLRGFEAFAVPHGIRLRKLEADESNMDAAFSGRMEILEKRLHQIEIRLFGGR